MSSLQFSHPWAALLFLVPLLLIPLRYWGRPRPALLFSRLSDLRLPGSWRLVFRIIPILLYLGAWGALTFSMMGPRLGHTYTNITAEGIAISMVSDVSGSMLSDRAVLLENGEEKRPIDVVGKVFQLFVVGEKDSELNGRPHDLIGLISFDTHVHELAPPTLDHQYIVDLMEDTIESNKADFHLFSQTNNQRGQKSKQTSLYDAAIVAIEQLNKIQSHIEDALKDLKTQYQLKSRVAILLTDGQDVSSIAQLDDVIDLAKENNIKIYTIAIQGLEYRPTFRGNKLVPSRFDNGPLKRIARESGGRFFSAGDAERLVEIYEAIDKLEKTKIEQEVTTELEPFQKPFLLAGLWQLLLALLLHHTLFRELP